MKLGTLLLRNAAIGLSQLEGALRNQVLYGGRLGTNLVELGFIDLELLSTYLAELTGYPLATPTQLDGADLDLLDRLGSDDAHRLRAIPLGDLGNTQTLSVAMVDPTDTRAISELSEKLGAKITPYVSTPVWSLVIGPPEAPIVFGSRRASGGEMMVQLSPSVVVLNSWLPAAYNTFGLCGENMIGKVHWNRYWMSCDE